MPASSPRLSSQDFARTAPAAYNALLALGKAVDDSGLEKGLTELVKLRASQINGCAYCLQLHLNIARKLGLPGAKIDLVAVWREAGVFTDREMAALAWAEALTERAAQGASDEDYATLLQHFSDSEAMFLTVSIGAINAWNRIAGALRFAPPFPPAADGPR